MNAEQITSLLNLGAAGAVIIVVVYFLRFIKERDKDWQNFFKALLDEKDAPIEGLSADLKILLAEFREHNTWEHTKLDGMEKALTSDRERTKPRRAAA